VRRVADVLAQLDRALPSVSHWIDDVLDAHRETSTAVSDLGFRRLSASFPPALLESARVAFVQTIPFPPMADLGIQGFDALATMPKAGITFRDMYFVNPRLSFENVHFHELVHVIQWRTLGFDDFLLTYAATVLTDGYWRSPLEAVASELEAEFRRGDCPSRVSERVADGARRARESAIASFRQCGLEFRGWQGHAQQ
jgi:hypothetical protein